MNNFDGKTWVAFSDLSGLKALYEKKPEYAAKALDKFYNTIYQMQAERNDINAIVVSDCAIFWIDIKDCIDKLDNILIHLKELHKLMLPDYLLRTTIAYGNFKYQQRLEMPRIRKNMIIGGAYLDSYANNDKIDHGAVVIVKLPERTIYRDLTFVSKTMIKANYPKKGFYEYFWAVEDSRQIRAFINEREKAKEATFSKLKDLYSDNRHLRWLANKK